jgi:hypothetical protein
MLCLAAYLSSMLRRMQRVVACGVPLGDERPTTRPVAYHLLPVELPTTVKGPPLS